LSQAFISTDLQLQDE